MRRDTIDQAESNLRFRDMLLTASLLDCDVVLNNLFAIHINLSMTAFVGKSALGSEFRASADGLRREASFLHTTPAHNILWDNAHGRIACSNQSSCTRTRSTTNANCHHVGTACQP